jgi:hypothetical protein
MLITKMTRVYNTTGVDTKPQFPGGISEFYKFVKFQNFGRSFKMKLKSTLKIYYRKDGSLSL